tara:strand:- start:2395 stop:3018 length:624 start_codon:yes stop_codon:yes gene_type:complete
VAITNYGTLKTEIAEFLNRTDLTAIIPTFITFAHNKLNRDLRTREMVARATANITSEYNAFPPNFLQIRDIRLNTTPPVALQQVSTEEQNQNRERRGDTAGRPRLYSVIGESFQVFPTPSSAVECEIAYYQKIEAMTADADYNWLLTKSPEIYLYGSLVHTAPYLKDDERIVLWQTLYRDIFNSLTLEDTKSRFGGTTPRMRARSFG